MAQSPPRSRGRAWAGYPGFHCSWPAPAQIPQYRPLRTGKQAGDGWKVWLWGIRGVRQGALGQRSVHVCVTM